MEHVHHLTMQYQTYCRLHWSTHAMLSALDDFQDTLEDLRFDNAAVNRSLAVARHDLTQFLQQCNLAMLAIQYRLQQVLTRR